MKKYAIKAKFTTTVDFPIIEAKNKREAVEKAELLLLDKNSNVDESMDHLPTWEVDSLIDN